MSTDDEPPRLVHGPYKRLFAAEVQDAQTALKQLLSGEIWGKPNQGAFDPSVVAYRGQLLQDESGIEFWAFQAPDNKVGNRAYWRTPGKFVEVDDTLELVKLKVAFVRITQDLVAGAL